MIHKNRQVGRHKCDLVEFGNGSVSMQPAFFKKEQHPALMMKSDERGYKVGDTNDEWVGKDSDAYNPEIIMVFKNEASLDSLISSLEDCRTLFKKQ